MVILVGCTHLCSLAVEFEANPVAEESSNPNTDVKPPSTSAKSTSAKSTSDGRSNKRWVLNVILILATAALLGVSMIPLLTTQVNQPAPSAASPSPTQSIAAQQDTLKKQAEGYELVLQREPDNQTALRGLLEAKLGLKDVKGAIAPLEKLVKLNPTVADYAVLLAQAKQQTGDREGATQVYREVLKTQPGELNALQGLTALLVDEKRPEAAIGLLQDTLKNAPQANQVQAGSVDVTAVQVLLGKVFASQKRFDESLRVFDDAIKTNKNDFQPVLYKAQVLKEQGKIDAAKPLFEQAVTLAPAQFKDQIKALAGISSTTAPTTAPTASPDAKAPDAKEPDAKAPAASPAGPESKN
jgi:tetratricopeptide (TPR) repeat protein